MWSDVDKMLFTDSMPRLSDQWAAGTATIQCLMMFQQPGISNCQCVWYQWYGLLVACTSGSNIQLIYPLIILGFRLNDQQIAFRPHNFGSF